MYPTSVWNVTRRERDDEWNTAMKPRPNQYDARATKIGVTLMRQSIPAVPIPPPPG